MKNAVVIGAGIAGIAVSIRLAVQGYQVQVFESNSYPGGKLTVLQQGGFRFDAGPSLFTMPQLVEELFLLAGKNPTDYFQYRQLDMACKYFFEDGTVIRGYREAARFAAEVEEVLGLPAAQTERHLAQAAKKYAVTKGIFLEKSLHKASTYLSKDVLRALVNLPSLHLMQSMHRVNERKLSHPKLVQIFDRFATYNGSDPYQAPGVMNLIPHLEHGIGACFPKGGMHSITTSLVQLAEDIGVKFHYGQGVGKIIVEDQRAVGIRLKAKETEIPADLVVSNMDVMPTYRKLLPEQPAPERVLRHPRSSSALIFYWGISAEFPELELHNIFFSQDYAAEFGTIFKDKTVHDDPTVYVHISARENDSDAPKGMENWFVMINVPSNQGQDWDQLIAQARQNILAKLSRILGRDIAPLIQNEDLLDPRSIEERTSSAQGALYGASSNSKLSAFLRHPNFSRKLKGLYFCGGSVHPGGGIPLCLLSARIVDDLVKGKKRATKA